MNARARALLRFAGKGAHQVAAVFADAPADSARAVAHLRAGAPDVPIWLFSTSAPLPETAALCERVHVRRNSLVLLAQAQRLLWPRWVAISVGAWTGRRGRWPLKLAPFLVPPFRALILNRHGDFLQATPGALATHWKRSLADAASASWNGLRTAAHWVRDRLADAGHILVAHGQVAFLAPVLEWAGRPHWRWFHKHHGSQVLPVHAPVSAGVEVARFHQPGSAWNSRQFAGFARSTGARWILWRNGTDAPEDLDRLSRLFEDAGDVFAVSVQTHFRAWKPVLVPTAPFRTLQPDEASQVLAPLSHTILVDRNKLLALGIPSVRLGATAWMLLAWKAAAAGWKCYSVGQEEPLVEQPDFPVQSTDFVLRVMARRELRRLGPREPDLARGCISFAPAFGRVPARKERMRVLLVSPFLPYPLSHGGAVRIYNLCAALSSRVEFILAAVREQGETVHYAKLHEVFREVHVLDIDQRAGDDPDLPVQVRGHRSSALRALIARLAQERRPDLMQVEFTHLASFRDAAPALPAILVEHDLTFTLYRQLAANQPSPQAAAEYERWLRFERYWLARYDGVWTVSDDDRKIAISEGGRDPSSTFTIDNGVDVRRFHPADEPADAPEIFYVGSFRHLPNILGFEKLRREVMPRLWTAFPHVRLRVVAGPKHEHFWRRFTGESLGALDGRIAVEGFVEDLRPLYARASVVVVPLEVSAGTNIKVLEAMACAKAVVTTPAGCAGLDLEDGVNACIRPQWDGFAASICELLRDPALRARIAAAARRTAADRFSWEAIANRAYDSYRVLLELEASRSGTLRAITGK